MEVLSILLFISFLIGVNWYITKNYANDRGKLIKASLVVILVATPLIYIITMITLGVFSGDGIAGAVGGFGFGFITFINGLIYFIKGFFFQKKV
ncbi:hypothetical protein [Sutcliffiella horikoshii]|uniref:hypothetical protein n=1 Tax=Sutcliffiella horikoshii TaxID=79883 RepID=UPI003CE9355B